MNKPRSISSGEAMRWETDKRFENEEIKLSGFEW